MKCPNPEYHGIIRNVLLAGGTHLTDLSELNGLVK